MKKRSISNLSKGIGYSTAVFFKVVDHGRSLSINGSLSDSFLY
ncbi:MULTISPECIES: hypothetical protein [Bacillus]|uniref:Uncharacterized protein n=1 Tax=Bacillus capparidis TaxID=1840411 RepID=A0ABS4D025_9BACI|nr:MULTISPECIES: hypothetical protein [Bacillus]MBP1082940.1 hypothetical protein [Bacillus capparidis]MED1098081.1 hypothetical protein [Bacillus capparidis]